MLYFRYNPFLAKIQKFFLMNIELLKKCIVFLMSFTIRIICRMAVSSIGTTKSMTLLRIIWMNYGLVHDV